MAQSTENGFVNKRTLDFTIESAGLSGRVTVPFIMTAEQLGAYMKQSRENFELLSRLTDDQGEIIPGEDPPDRVDMARKLISGLIIDIDFPGVTLEQIKKGKPAPFPAVVFKLQEILKPTVDDAINLKN